MVNLMVRDGEILKIYLVRGAVGSCEVLLSTNTVIHKKSKLFLTPGCQKWSSSDMPKVEVALGSANHWALQKNSRPLLDLAELMSIIPARGAQHHFRRCLTVI